MAAKPFAITSDRLVALFALARTEISWPTNVLRSLESQGLDRIDVVHIWNTGSLISSKEETSHGKEIVIAGLNCDDEALEITFLIDDNATQIVLKSVTRI